ncbi:MAG: hypothetical protein HOC71_10880, partial [Candidatus Latescibacteria bacterium]|nr:hypothetical protein [Candidatus Latescibacterota bacterium]
LAYDQSMLAARHLMSLRRGDALREIITDLTNGVDFQTAFLNAVGYSVAEFEMEYNRRLNKAYGIRTVLTWLPGTWTVILMISVIVYIVKKKQNRRLLKHWEEIEKPGNVVDFKPFPQDE